MKRLTLLASLAIAFIIFSVPALAQGNTADQYGDGGIADSEPAARKAVEDLIGEEGADVDGAEAYAAALKAAQNTDLDEETAEAVAAEAVSEISKKPELPKEPKMPEEPKVSKGSEEAGIIELPDTGGVSYAALAGGILLGSGLLIRRVMR